VTTGYHTRWVIPDEHREHPDYIAAGKRIAFGQAVYDCRARLGLSETDLAAHAGLDVDQVEAIETGGVEPTLELIELLARALNAAVRLDPGAETPIRFEARAA
jgi:transcriptional regulator with XRE-family HTH domain